ncbi:MAG: polyhydroxyalkanoate synthesis repressor PhaR [Burkholderiales bacterium]|nr:polyhydroxyalkanoate synthesis repressor PhaR [Burkholderiales bacterium]
MSTSRRQQSTTSAKSQPTNETPGVDAEAPTPAGVRAIKKYPNRRLYDTQTSSYITLVDIKAMVLACENFLVLDAKTGEDLTRSILLQIILEEEAGGVPMFSAQALAQIIRFYGNTMQGLMGNYLEKNIQSFIDLQSSLTEGSVVNLQAPLMQNFMGGYMEQSRQMFTQMQEQMSKQAETLIGNFGGGLASTLTPKK